MKKETRYCYRCNANRQFEIYCGNEKAVLRGSSHAVLRESSHAVLWESSHAVLRESSHAVLSKFACAHIHGKQVKCKGGVQIKIPEIATAKEWCDYYGAEIKKGVAVLFKGVDGDYSTSKARQKNIFYKPGLTPVAPDWDGGKQECGGGLHFSPTAGHTLNFNSEAKHFIACPVKVSKIKVHKNAQYPEKVKAPGLAAPCWEVDYYGKRIS